MRNGFLMRVSGIALPAAACLLAACAGRGPAAPDDVISSAEPPPAAAESMPDGERKVPFRLEVTDELNDGKRIHLKLHLRSEGAWDPAALAVRLSGLNAGEVVQEESFPLRILLEREGVSFDAAEPRLPEEAVFALSLPAQGLTDYQVELLWGDEAAGPASAPQAAALPPLPLNPPPAAESPPPAPPSPAAAAPRLVLRNLTWHEKRDCTRTPCRTAVSLEGEFHNNGAEPVKRAQLTVQFRRPAPNGYAVVDEQTVQVDGLDLGPGESRRLEMEVDRGASTPALLGTDPMIRIDSEE